MRFLSRMPAGWNISLFHYRNQGADYGRILVGMQVPPKDEKALRRVPRHARLSLRRRDRQSGLPAVPASSRGYCVRKLSGDGRLGFGGRGFVEPARAAPALRLHGVGAGAGAPIVGAMRRRRCDRRRHGSGSRRQRRHRGRRRRAGRRQDAGGRCRQRRQLEQDAARALRRTERGGAQPDRLQHQVAVELGADGEGARRLAVDRDQRQAVGAGRPRACSSAAPSRRPGGSATALPARLPRPRRRPAARRTAGPGRRATATARPTAPRRPAPAAATTPKRSAQNTSASRQRATRSRMQTVAQTCGDYHRTTPAHRGDDR